MQYTILEEDQRIAEQQRIAYRCGNEGNAEAYERESLKLAEMRKARVERRLAEMRPQLPTTPGAVVRITGGNNPALWFLSKSWDTGAPLWTSEAGVKKMPETFAAWLRFMGFRWEQIIP